MPLTNLSNLTAAKALSPKHRKRLALQVIKNKQTITEAASKNKVSRKFIHRLKDTAIEGVNQSFQPKPEHKEAVLFYLPITKKWLAQFILCLLLHCRASFRGVTKVLEDVFDYRISVGTLHNITQVAKQTAKGINAKQDLSGVTLGANDEIFHYNKPILAGVDIPSLYCYLLSQEQDREGDTWAIHLWDLEQQGFNPERIFADHGDGLRSGHQTALPHIPCDADHFHLIKKLTDMRRFFQNRLKSAISYQITREEKMEKAKLKGQSHTCARTLGIAKQETEQRQFLSESLNTLVSWMQHDVLDKAGVNPDERGELFDFIVDELKKLATLHPHRIQDVCTALQNQRHLLLAFVDVLDEKFQKIADQFSCSLETVWHVCKLQRCQPDGDQYAIRSVPLLLAHGEPFYAIEDAVIVAMNSTERTSSMIENLNSRLRPYFFLRREIGFDYLELLRFYLNHIPFLRSNNNRANKTPATLLTKQSHPHWLEMLGFERFKRAA